MRQFWVLFKANLVTNLRNRTAVFFNLISPLLFFLIFGAIFSKSSSGSGPSTDATAPGAHVPYTLFLLAGVIVANQLGSGLFGGAAVLVTWRERGIFRRIQATPMPVSQLILARVLSQLVVMVVQAALVIGVAQLVFGVHPVARGVGWTVLFVVVGGMVFLALGQLIGARTRRVETANVLINVLFLPLLFFADLYIPLALMPDWLQAVGKLLPTYLVVALLRPAITAGTLPTNAAALLLGLAVYFVVSVAISARIFRFS